MPSRKHEGKVGSYRDLNDPKYTVASKPATTGEEAVKKYMPRSSCQPADTEIKGAEMVLNGKADAFFYDLPLNALLVAMHGGDKLILLNKTFTVEPIAWAVRKNDPDFLEWLNQFLEQIKADRRYDQIYNKWFKQTDWIQYAR